MFSKFLKDESGFINVANYLLLTTIIGVGMIAGLAALRDSVVQQLGDVALGLENLDHTYTVNCRCSTFGYIDNDLGGPDQAGQPPGEIEICLPATRE